MTDLKKYELPELTSEMGNAFEIMAYVKQALTDNNCKKLIKGYLERATSGNYANLIGESYLMLDHINKKNKKHESKNK